MGQKSVKVSLSSKLITKKEMRFTKPKLMEPLVEAIGLSRDSRCTRTKLRAFKSKHMKGC